MIGVDLFWLLYMVSSYQKVIKKISTARASAKKHGAANVWPW